MFSILSGFPCLWQSPSGGSKNKLWICFFLSQLQSKSTKHEEWVLIFGLRIEINWIRRSSFTDSVKFNRADCKWEMFYHKGVYSTDGTSLLLFLWWACGGVMYSHMQWCTEAFMRTYMTRTTLTKDNLFYMVVCPRKHFENALAGLGVQSIID